jgi:Flp pilus assembly pilin Flp
MNTKQTLQKLRNDEKGISAVEYLIALAVVAFLIIGGFAALGTEINDEAVEAGTVVDSLVGGGG